MNRKDPPSLGEAYLRILSDPAVEIGPSLNLPEPPLEEKLSEGKFMARVVAYAKRRGWLWYHTHNSRRSKEGFPDLVLVRKGEIIFAELKVGDNEATPEQAAWLDALRETGAASGVWRPESWPDIIKALE
jgi:hypothetical protein